MKIQQVVVSPCLLDIYVFANASVCWEIVEWTLEMCQSFDDWPAQSNAGEMHADNHMLTYILPILVMPSLNRIYQ